jgi:hypothetical protein
MKETQMNNDYLYNIKHITLKEIEVAIERQTLDNLNFANTSNLVYSAEELKDAVETDFLTENDIAEYIEHELVLGDKSIHTFSDDVTIDALDDIRHMQSKACNKILDDMHKRSYDDFGYFEGCGEHLTF